MLDSKHLGLSLKRQCDLLGINRSSIYYKSRPIRPEDLEMMKLIDDQYENAGLRHPLYAGLFKRGGGRRGFMYLVAIMDWHSRKVLSWHIPNTLDSESCVSALEEAIARHGSPEIFNTDQGSQFTSMAFTNVLKSHDIKISMDGCDSV